MAKFAENLWGVIRKDLDSGKLFVDRGSLALLPEDTRKEIEKTRNEIPHWDRANPIERLTVFEVSYREI